MNWEMGNNFLECCKMTYTTSMRWYKIASRLYVEYVGYVIANVAGKVPKSNFRKFLG